MSLKKKFLSVTLSVTTAVWVSGVSLFIPQVAGAVTIAELQAQIAALTAQLNALIAQQGGGAAKCTFTRSLFQGVSGDDVKCLQQYLNSTTYKVATSGAGSPGSETTFYGSRTKAAVAAWQAGNGVSPVAGYFGPKSQAKYDSLVATTPPSTTLPPVVGVGSGLTVTPGPQPSAGLFPEFAVNMPFTRVVLTASADGDVTVKSITVERTGFANDAVFRGVVLLDENNQRIGIDKTLNSVHQAKLDEKFVVKAGQSRTLTIAGDAPASSTGLDSYAGQVAVLSVVAVDAGTSAVNGTFPISGASHNVNATLSIGSLSRERGPLDPGSSQTKEVGTTGYIFASLKFTAGSGEDLSFKSIRFNQSGSAATADLANVKIYVGSTAYDTTVSSDGKYYSATFGAGIDVAKGNSVEVNVKGDIVAGSNRTVDFDLYRAGDVYFVGKTFSYGVGLPTNSAASDNNDDDGEFQSVDPYWDAFQATIGAGSLTVEKATTGDAAAQNIAENVLNQPLGGFIVDVKGEPVSVASTVFRLVIDNQANGVSAADIADITNIAIYDENGAIVAGPQDGSGAADNGTVTFSDTVTYPVGRKTYLLKGKIGTDITNNETITASSTPASDWTTVRGLSTGQTITPSGGTVTLNTMTVKTGALTVTIPADPVAQNIVAGTQGFTWAKYVFDATASGENVRVTQVLLQATIATANSADDWTNCQLFDGTTALNTGTNIVNPANSVATGDEVTYTLDTHLVVPKGTTKTIPLKCNLVAGGTFTTGSWGIESAAANVIASGISSGESISETITTNAGQTMTAVSAGSLAVALGAASPSERLALANTTDVVLAVLQFTATNEAIDVTQIGLQLSGTASNTPQDLSSSPASVTLWEGATKVGEAVFTSDNATATLSGFTVPKDSDAVLTIKGNLAAIGTSLSGRPGHRMRVDYDGDAADAAGDATRGKGVSAGTAIYSTGSDTASAGVRIFKAYPTLAKISAPSLTLVDGQLILYRFSVTAPSTGGAGLYKFTFDTATSGGNTAISYRVTDYQAYGYSDSAFTQPAYGTSGLLNSGGLVDCTGGTTPCDEDADQNGIVEIYFNPINAPTATNEAINVPAGTTRYFELKGTVTGSTATTTLSLQMEGDEAYFKSATSTQAGAYGDDFFFSTVTAAGANYAFATTASLVDADNNHDDFIWSGNSTTTVGVNHYDWVNGYLVSGLPGTNMSSNSFSR